MLTSTMWNIPATDHALCGQWPGSDEGAQFFACGNYPRVCPLQLNTWLTQSCPLKVYWCSGMKQCRLLPSKWYCFWLQKSLYVSHREYNSAVWRLAGQQKLTCVVDSVQVTRGAWHTHKQCVPWSLFSSPTREPGLPTIRVLSMILILGGSYISVV